MYTEIASNWFSGHLEKQKKILGEHAPRPPPPTPSMMALYALFAPFFLKPAYRPECVYAWIFI